MKLSFNLEKIYGSFKLLNATNGGPYYKRHAKDQFRSNFEAYKTARIPYSRNAVDRSIIFTRSRALILTAR